MIRISYKESEKEQFEKEYWSVIESLLKKNIKRTIDDELKNWKNNYNICNMQGAAYTIEEVVLMEYAKLRELKKKIDDVFSNMEYAKDKYKCFYKKKGTNVTMKMYWEEYRAQYDKMRIRRKDSKALSAEIVEYFNTKVCAYCNRAYIDNREVQHNNSIVLKSTAQLDHFFSKEKYPIFALSLYNFVPVCQVCNSKKGKYEINVSPHDREFDFSQRIFTYEVGEEFYSELGIKVKIRDDVNNDLKRDMKRLDIDSAYLNNNDVVWEVIEKKRMYDEYRIKEIIESLGLPYSESEIERLLYGNYINENEYSKRPLAKLVSDIVNEINLT